MDLRFEVLKNQLCSVADEMGAVLVRAAHSVNIKERKDCSSAVFDARGRMIAQAEHIPVHLGSMPLSVQAALAAGPLAEGDLVILNDPYLGGTHLPDVTLVRPVFLSGRLRFLTATRAHYSDIGGSAPGSMPLARELYQEGIILPPVKLRARGRLCDDLVRVLLASLRNPREAEVDLAAQIASCDVGAARLAAIVARAGEGRVLAFCGRLLDYDERLMRSAIRRIPPGRYRFADALDDDGVSPGRVPIVCTVTIRRDGRARVDFAGSAAQRPGNVNAPFAVTLSAVLYCFRCLIREAIPANAGCLRPLEVVAPAGTVVNACRPAACAAGNVETSQRVVDAVFGALGQAIPLPAASCGTMSNFSFGGAGFAYYETIGGGMGARPGRAGVDGVQCHMTNTLNTPIEVLETGYPVRVTEYRLRRGSGGRPARAAAARGAQRGGDGIVREFEFLAEATVSVVSDRRVLPPWGTPPGKTGANFVDGRRMPGKFTVAARPGTRVRIETPGGGGRAGGRGGGRAR
ncbi:MAG: hydantoinase B/oxoprolinase family protein [Planctomycetes bacterium]|nr:hydantoinase B/oxoprolinase family protein [Planctomycetota bacterium]